MVRASLALPHHHRQADSSPSKLGAEKGALSATLVPGKGTFRIADGEHVVAGDAQLEEGGVRGRTRRTLAAKAWVAGARVVRAT